MTERFIIDDCGTLIDIKTRNTYDYVSEVCPLLNQMNHSIETYKSGNRTIQARMKELSDKNQNIKNRIKEALANERTQIGQNVLKQLLESICE